MSHPPLRTKILSLLQKHREGLTVGKIESALEVKRRERAKFLAALEDLEDEKLVRRLNTRFVLAPKSGLNALLVGWATSFGE